MTPPFLEAWAVALVHGLVKGGLLLALALAIARFLPRLSAALRARILEVALAGALLVGPLAILAPGWGPRWDVAPSSPWEPRPESSAQGTRPDGARPEAPPAASPFPDAGAQIPGGWRTGLFTLWLTGIGLGVARLWADHRARGRMAAGAVEASAPELRAALDACRAELGLLRRIDLLESSAMKIPSTWGLRRPRVVLPATAASWSAERLRVVLLHELAHVVRGDVWSRLLARWTCILLWFHPLVWIAARRLELETEHACDDRVLERGVSASTYLDELLGLVRELRSAPPPVPLLAATGRRDFELRALAIADPGRPRSAPSGTVIASVALVALVATTALAGLASKPERSDPDLLAARASQPDAVLELHLLKALERGVEADKLPRLLELTRALEADAAREAVLLRLLQSRSLGEARLLTVLDLIDGMDAVAAREAVLLALAASQELTEVGRRRALQAAARLDRPLSRRAVLRALTS